MFATVRTHSHFMKPKLLTAVEAAQLKGVTRSAIYAAIREGRLPHQIVLGRMGVTEDDVLAWTPTPSTGRREGTRLSEETRAKIAASQKRRWEQRKTQSDSDATNDPPPEPESKTDE